MPDILVFCKYRKSYLSKLIVRNGEEGSSLSLFFFFFKSSLELFGEEYVDSDYPVCFQGRNCFFLFGRG